MFGVNTRHAAATILGVMAMFAVASCGTTESSSGVTAADAASVESQTKDLQKSASTLGADLGQCVQDAVGGLLSGETSDLGKCVDRNLQKRADLAQNADQLIKSLVPKASGECSTKLKSLGSLAGSVNAFLTKALKSLDNGLDASSAATIGSDLSKLLSTAEADWSALKTACTGG